MQLPPWTFEYFGGFREAIVRKIFFILVSHPPPVSFEILKKKQLFFANGEGVFFSADMKQEISFRASFHDHDPDWRSRRAHDSQS